LVSVPTGLWDILAALPDYLIQNQKSTDRIKAWEKPKKEGEQVSLS
jgi:hypothetical protein